MTRKANVIAKYRKQIVDALKANNKYNEGLELMINSTADSLKTLDICRKEIDSLDKTTIDKVGRYGIRIAPHPVFKTQRNAQHTLVVNCRALGLTNEELIDSMTDNSLIEMMREANADDE